MLTEKIFKAIIIFRTTKIERRGVAKSIDDEMYSYVLIDDLIDCVGEVESQLGMFSYMSLCDKKAILSIHDAQSEEVLTFTKELPDDIYEHLNSDNMTVEYLSLESRIMRSMYRNIYKITGLNPGEDEKFSFLSPRSERLAEKFQTEVKSEEKEVAKENSAKEDHEQEQAKEPVENPDTKSQADEIEGLKDLLYDIDEQEGEEMKQAESYDAQSMMKLLRESSTDDGFDELEDDELDEDEMTEDELEEANLNTLAYDDELSELDKEDESFFNPNDEKESKKVIDKITLKISDYINNNVSDPQVQMDFYKLVCKKLIKQSSGVLSSGLEAYPLNILEETLLNLDYMLPEIYREAVKNS